MLGQLRASRRPLCANVDKTHVLKDDLRAFLSLFIRSADSDLDIKLRLPLKLRIIPQVISEFSGLFSIGLYPRKPVLEFRAAEDDIPAVGDPGHFDLQIGISLKIYIQFLVDTTEALVFSFTGNDCLAVDDLCIDFIGFIRPAIGPRSKIGFFGGKDIKVEFFVFGINNAADAAKTQHY